MRTTIPSNPRAKARGMQELAVQIQEAVDAIRRRWHGRPTVGIILGTGLGSLAAQIRAEAPFEYESIPHFPRSTSVGHAGQLVCGELEGVTVVAMEGRFHAYEGYSYGQITFPARILDERIVLGPPTERVVVEILFLVKQQAVGLQLADDVFVGIFDPATLVVGRLGGESAVGCDRANQFRPLAVDESIALRQQHVVVDFAEGGGLMDHARAGVDGHEIGRHDAPRNMLPAGANACRVLSTEC